MRRYWKVLAAFATLALLPLALTAGSPPAETPATEDSNQGLQVPAETSRAMDLEALVQALFLPEADRVSNHCCSPQAEANCAAACAPDPSFTACSGTTCFCACIIIN